MGPPIAATIHLFLTPLLLEQYKMLEHLYILMKGPLDEGNNQLEIYSTNSLVTLTLE